MRRTFSTIFIIAIVTAVAAFFWKRQADTTANLVALQRQYDELRSQFEIRNQSATGPLLSTTDNPIPQYSAGSEIELARRMADLVIMQSNTVVLIEKLMAHTANWQVSPTPEQRESNVAALTISAREYQQNLEVAKQTVADLLVNLSIPDNISTMDPDKALDMASLKPYWTFFEVKRKRENMQRLAIAVQLRLDQEQIEGRLVP